MRKILYHGSDVILKKPLYGVGKEDNDYGSGFYTTEDIEKAREWAWVNGSDKSAVCNQYSIDLDGLNVLNLDEHGTLAWIAEVTNHRGASDEFTQAVADKLVEMYKIDTSKADVIIGYRADDSYMNVVKSFLRNQLSVDEVDRMFRNGNLGQQVFIKSEKVFDRICFEDYENVSMDKDSHYGEADAKARREVGKFLHNREYAIQIDGFKPAGLTVKDVISTQYEYNKEYGCYLQEERANERNEFEIDDR